MVDFNIGKWLKDVLTRDQGVNALIGGRIYPVGIWLAVTYPAITYRRLGVDLPSDMRGLSGPIRPTVRINAWDTDYDSACQVSSMVLEALKDGGITKQPTTSGLRLGLIIPKGAGDEFYQKSDASKDFLYGPYVDFLISYEKR